MVDLFTNTKKTADGDHRSITPNDSTRENRKKIEKQPWPLPKKSLESYSTMHDANEIIRGG